MTNENAVAIEVLPPKKMRPDSAAAQPKQQPPFHVVLWNDDSHTWEYVIELLMKLFGYPFEKAFQITHHVHHRGRGIAFTTHKELAELKREQVVAFGADVYARAPTGPLRVTIEPAQ